VNRAVFLDLNGILVEPVQIESLSELQVLPGTFEAVHRLNKAGFLCPVVTVQSRIAKAYFSQPEFVTWFQTFACEAALKGAELLGPYTCPHRFNKPCRCEKPKPHLYKQAARDHLIDLSRSYVVGDTASDVIAASAFGGRGCLVKTGWGHFENNQEAAKKVAAPIRQTLTEAVTWILSTEGH